MRKWFQVSLKSITCFPDSSIIYLFILFMYFSLLYLAEKLMYRFIHERFCFACCFFLSSTTRWSSLFLGTSAEMVTTAVKN